MKFPRIKLTSRHMLLVLALLGLVLAALIIAGALGYRLGEDLMGKVTNGVMIVAVGVLLYSRKLRADEEREKEAAKDKAKDEGAKGQGEGGSPS